MFSVQLRGCSGWAKCRFAAIGSLALLWFGAPLPAMAQAQALDVAINEIAWMGTLTSANDEWIELINNTGAPIDLAGWTLASADGTPNIALSGVIPAGGHFLLERTDDSTVPDVAADQIYTGALSNTVEILELRDASSVLQDRVDAWYAGSAATRETMQRVDPTQPGTLAANWTDGPVEGTPTNSGGGGSTCAAPLRAVDCQAGPPFVFRSGGPIVVNEVMVNPAAVADASGEYVELYNSGSVAIDLAGWTLRDDNVNSYTIPAGSPVLIGPGAVFVIAANGNPATNGGLTPDLVWSSFALANAGDQVVLEDAIGVEQDRLVYTAAPFTVGSGRSLERVSHRLPTSDPLSWAEARQGYGLGDRGTPGAANGLQSRRYVLSGTLVTMDETLAVADRVFPGKVYVQGNRILDVLHAADPLPQDAAGAPVLDTEGLIFPGLMNIHDHIAFNTIPAWPVPALMQDVADWTSHSEYQQYVRYPHEILTNADYYDLLPEVGKYAEIKALAAGTTAVQGSFPISAGFTGHLARNVDLTNFGVDRIRQRSLSVLDSNFQTQEAPALVTDMDAGTVDAWLVHLAEGTAEDALLEFQVLKNVCLLRSETVIIHGTALTASDLDELAAAGGKLVIAPTSNYLYYGGTADVPGALQRGIPVSLSTDWGPAGDKNLLASMKTVDFLDALVWGNTVSDLQIAEMVTTAPAKALNWCKLVGSLRPGLFADLTVIGGAPAAPYRSLIEATEEDVKLTVVDGDALYGRPAFLDVLKPSDHEPVASGCSFQAALDITEPSVLRGTESFSDVLILLSQASEFDFQHMKANFQDPVVAGMTDEQFQAYLDQRFPLGIIPRPLDPIWIIDDPDYFPGLRNETNVTALDPEASLDTEPYWDPDGDGVLDPCDNCPGSPNPSQGSVVFGQEVLAAGPTQFSWSTPADVRFVRGPLAAVDVYGIDLAGALLGATSLTDTEVPAPGEGFYYLVRLAGSCTVGSWQSTIGAEPGRDLILP